jgi:membrane protein
MPSVSKAFPYVARVLKSSFTLFIRHDVPTLGAALSFYTVFSLAPLLVIVVSITGILLGPQAIEGEISAQMQSVLGTQGANLVENIVKAAYKPGSNLIITIIAIAVLIIGASSVFGQLRSSLNTIWEVKDSAKKPVLKFLFDRIFSLAMIGCLIFLLLVSLIVHAALDAFTNYVTNRLPGASLFLIKLVNHSLAYILTVILFAIIYKYLSDAKLKWQSVWWGALFTALLFTLGKYLIGLYLGQSNLADTYGAAGSVVLILFWVFYSSQIFFFGAEFTRVLAIESNVSIDTGSAV